MTELVPCHVEHAYARRTTDLYTGGDHVVLDGPLALGRLRRDVDDALCKPRGTFRDMVATGDDREPNCAACLRHLERLQALGVLERPTGGRRTRTLPCLKWAATFGDAEDRCARCELAFELHGEIGRLAGWLRLTAARAGHGLPPLPAPAFVRAELERAIAEVSHPHHDDPSVPLALSA